MTRDPDGDEQRRTFVVGPGEGGTRVDRALWAWLRAADGGLDTAAPAGRPALGTQAAGATRSAVQRLIVRGAVAVNGRVVTHPSATVEAGYRVVCTLRRADSASSPVARPAPTVQDAQSWILYEDDCLLAVDKPAGLPTHATVDPARPHLFGALQALLAARGDREPYLGLHHRLDVDTTGVVLFATDRRANPGLAARFAERRVDKRYLALAEPPAAGRAGGGRTKSSVTGRSWTVRNHLGRVSRRGDRARYGPVRAGGEAAETTFTVRGVRGRRVLLEASPQTGRTHQIRVHAAGSGLPLVGDVLYGGVTGPRVLLHAASLSLDHPLTGRRLVLRAPVPPDFGSVPDGAAEPASAADRH